MCVRIDKEMTGQLLRNRGDLEQWSTYKRFEVLPVLTVSSKRVEVRRVDEYFFLSGLFCRHRIYMEWTTLVLGISINLVNGTQHRA